MADRSSGTSDAHTKSICPPGPSVSRMAVSSNRQSRMRSSPSKSAPTTGVPDKMGESITTCPLGAVIT